MSGRGGKRQGAGRKPGSKDRSTVEQSATLSELAREHTSTALDVLVQVAQASESDAARVSAANSILDRGYGKPTQPTEHTGKDGAPLDLGGTELARLIAFELTRAAKDA